MSNFKLNREEQETIIRGSAGSRVWEVVSADPRIIRYMAKQGYKPDGRPNPWGYSSYSISSDKVRIGRSGKSKRGFAAKKPVALHNNDVSGSQNSPGMVG